jgi:hypothetical protein
VGGELHPVAVAEPASILHRVGDEVGAISKLDPGAPTTLTWELDPDGDHTLLHFTNTVSEPVDDTTAAGWHLHLDALATILSGGQVGIAHPDPIFEPIHEAYTEKHGSADD